MKMDLVIVEIVGANAVPGSCQAHERIRDVGRFLHHFAHLSGQGNATATDVGDRLHHQYRTAERGPCQPHYHAGRGNPVALLVSEHRLAEKILQSLRGNLDRHGELVHHHLPGNLAMNPVQRLLEVANARLARPTVTDRAQHAGRVLDLLPGDAGALQRLRNEVAASDVHFFLLDVTGQPDHFHAIEQRRRYGVHRVGRGDEHDRRNIEWQIEVMIAERVILLAVQNFQQGG